MIKILDCKFDNKHDNLFIQSIKSWPPYQCCAEPRGCICQKRALSLGGGYSLDETRRNNSRTTSSQALFKRVQARRAEDMQVREGEHPLCPPCPCAGCAPGPPASLSLHQQSCPFQPILPRLLHPSSVSAQASSLPGSCLLTPCVSLIALELSLAHTEHSQCQ